MKTIEEIYAEMFEEHENVMAARRQERIKASNPYGCNQYGEGWTREHNGKRSKPGEPIKKGDAKKDKEKTPEKTPEMKTPDKKGKEKASVSQQQKDYDNILEQANAALEEMDKKSKLARKEMDEALKKRKEEGENGWMYDGDVIRTHKKWQETGKKSGTLMRQRENLKRSKEEYDKFVKLKEKRDFDPEEPIDYDVDKELEQRKRDYEENKRLLIKTIESVYN